MMHIPCNMDLYNGNEINILKRVVRLFFDLLHGIKCMDVPLVMALEFSIFLGYDRQLEMDSDLERELFASVIEQLKEGSKFELFTEIYKSHGSLIEEYKNDKARKCTGLALCYDLGKVWRACYKRKRSLEFWR